ncbi:hypothetical protein ES731_03470 [Psychroflexus gondwanensis]|jgi:threonylcarbamoyladenosine tRNA methylthiotransferase MtaB|uniref:hypothetical protein n=1 Tax=Psychroflexus gondwanensis TaxID=251 RepID=UPI0011BFCFED|nr:hypothetical protein [Psychroflexus gondwanensis]TXE21099.1 hypothetical protein ES731_03470 [Psychroflexus gondwanensis]
MKTLKNSTPKLAFYALGCKLSSSETSNIARNFTDKGYERVEFKEFPIIQVKNTSSVTENVVKSFG